MKEAELLLYLWTVACVAVRVSALFIFFPFFSSLRIPNVIKAAGCFLFSMALHSHAKSSVPSDILNMNFTISSLLFFLIKEFFIGMGLGLIAKFFFQACLSSAEWIGMQLGFGMGSVMDPMSEQHESSWAVFHDWMAMMVFLSFGGQWWCIQAIADSYQFSFQSLFENLMHMQKASLFWVEIGRGFFFWILKLSGPMLAVVMFLQFGLGVLSKFIPQINLWTVSIPITLGVGVFAFSLFSPMYGDILAQLFQSQREHFYIWLKFLGQ